MSVYDVLWWLVAAFAYSTVAHVVGRVHHRRSTLSDDNDRSIVSFFAGLLWPATLVVLGPLWVILAIEAAAVRRRARRETPVTDGVYR